MVLFWLTIDFLLMRNDYEGNNFDDTTRSKLGEQMTSWDVYLTKGTANRRIYFEQAISRMKCFRIIKYELPLSHIDNIKNIFADICNIHLF